MNHMGNFKFPSDHIKKVEINVTGEIKISYLTQYIKILSFHHVSNIKSNEIFYFFCTKCSKSSVCFILVAHLSSEELHFKHSNVYG